MTYDQARQDDSLEEIDSKDLPDLIALFIESKILGDLPDPLILDYAEYDTIKFPFIPAIPRNLSDYDFYVEMDPSI